MLQHNIFVYIWTLKNTVKNQIFPIRISSKFCKFHILIYGTINFDARQQILKIEVQLKVK